MKIFSKNRAESSILCHAVTITFFNGYAYHGHIEGGHRHEDAPGAGSPATLTCATLLTPAASCEYLPYYRRHALIGSRLQASAADDTYALLRPLSTSNTGQRCTFRLPGFGHADRSDIAPWDTSPWRRQEPPHARQSPKLALLTNSWSKAEGNACCWTRLRQHHHGRQYDDLPRTSS